MAYFNFETNLKLNETFEENISPDYLVPILFHISGQTIIKEKTLIVFDEVQLCERALTSLKYFCEDAPDYHIIMAGSLLGVAVNRAKFSFPVGKVDIETLYPMDMEELLLALGENALVEQIKNCFKTDKPMPSALHDTAMQLYRQYLVIRMQSNSLQKTLHLRIIKKWFLSMQHFVSKIGRFIMRAFLMFIVIEI